MFPNLSMICELGFDKLASVNSVCEDSMEV